MPEQLYESTLNTWLAAALRERGLDAHAENKQGGGKRLDVELALAGLKIALEAEQGFTSAKKASAIKDADSRLRDDLADCALAICYPAGLGSESELSDCELLHTLRSHKERPPASKTSWQRGSIAQLASVLRKIPDQLGDPDEIANRLSFSLERAVARLSESQKQDVAACLDLPAGKPTTIAAGNALSSRFNQAAKRAMLVIATAIMFHSQLDKHRHQLKPRQHTGDWPPATASQCAESHDPVGAFSQAWKLWLVVDYKPIFETARSALQALAGSHEFSAAVQVIARASLQVTRNIVGLRHDLLGRIFHKALDTARYDGSFYTTTAAATLLANLAIDERMLDWTDPAAIAQLRITDPACGTGTLLMAAAERIRDLTSAGEGADEISRWLIESVLTGYDVNLTATHLAATTLGLLSPTTTFEKMKIYRALLGIDENNEAKLGSLEFLDTGAEGQPRLLAWPTGVEQIETQAEVAQAESADLVIMNPPFTRDSLRHDQFSRADERKLKAREKELFDSVESQSIHRSHNGGGFLQLAEHIAKPNNGAIAVVLPLVGATNYSTRLMRMYLAKQFHIEIIVTSHDPTRIYFSENTSIGEMLLICRRLPPPPSPLPQNEGGGAHAASSLEDNDAPQPERWRISPELRRRMRLVARELRRNPTAAEDKLWQALRKRQLDGRKFRRQVAIGAFVVDFYCSTERLVVEVDGPIHETQQTADRIRQALIESLGIRFVRLTNDMVENRLQAALEIIRAAFGSSPQKMKARVHSAATYNTDDPAQIDESPLPHFGGGGLGVGASSKTRPPTKIVNLYENPATPAAALGVARNIVEDNRADISGTVQAWPRERIEKGDWGGVQFLSPFLCERFIELRAGHLFATRELGKVAEIGPAGRGIRGFANRSDVPDRDGMTALWYHKTDVTQKMATQWDTYLHPKPGKHRQLAALWEKRGQLMIATRARLNTVRGMSVRLNQEALGSLWIPCKPCSADKYSEKALEKALCAYFNSTIGILGFLGDRSNKIPSYPQMSMDDLRRIPVPDFNALRQSQVTALATAFDTLCNFTLLPLPQIMQDETRLALDRVVAESLGIAPEITASIRRELSREPSITGKPYET